MCLNGYKVIKNSQRSIIFVALCLFSLAIQAGSLKLVSPAFGNTSQIPKQYTCEGADVSPPLFWQNPPDNTQSFVLIVDDVDAPAGDWVHWLLFNIPADIWILSEAAEVPKGALSGQNSWGQTGYRGPCPPGGKHHYFFKLYALDTILNLKSDATRQDVFDAMDNHVLETSELIGIYSKETSLY